MAHTLTLLTRVRVRRVSLDQGKYRVEGDVFYLLRFFLTMPSRDTPASSRTEASMAALEPDENMTTFTSDLTSDLSLFDQHATRTT